MSSPHSEPVGNSFFHNSPRVFAQNVLKRFVVNYSFVIFKFEARATSEENPRQSRHRQRPQIGRMGGARWLQTNWYRLTAPEVEALTWGGLKKSIFKKRKYGHGKVSENEASDLGRLQEMEAWTGMEAEQGLKASTGPQECRLMLQEPFLLISIVASNVFTRQGCILQISRAEAPQRVC